MLESREKVASKDSEAEALGEESDEFDTDESPLHKGFELDMNMTDTDQTKVISFQSQLYLTGMVWNYMFLLLPLQEAKTTRHWRLGLCLNSQGAEEWRESY